MDDRSTYIQQITEMSSMLSQQVGELDDATLSKRPGPALNPVGFIYWHILRVWDLDLNWLIKGGAPGDDAWHRGGYSNELDYTPDGVGTRGMGIGTGYTDNEVDAVPYRADVLARYQRQLLDETNAYLSEATDEELQRELPLRDQTTTVAARLQHTVSHSWNHVGEIRMTKSMLGYPDPTTPPRS